MLNKNIIFIKNKTETETIHYNIPLAPLIYYIGGYYCKQAYTIYQIKSAKSCKLVSIP